MKESDALKRIVSVLSDRERLLGRDDELWGAYSQCVAALAAGSRRAETNEDLAQCEASQSGAAKTAQRPTSVASSDKERE